MAKIDLKKAAQEATEDMEDDDKLITEELLKETCPKEFMAAFKKAKSAGQRADFLYEQDDIRLDLQKRVKAMSSFLFKLERWFMQNLPDEEATGIAGKKARVQIEKKEVPKPVDWNKLYKHIHKNKEFDLLNRGLNTKAVKQRWEAGEQVPGVERREIRVVSVTKVERK